MLASLFALFISMATSGGFGGGIIDASHSHAAKTHAATAGGFGAGIID